uniref:Uncharacterized protein n=1 Tax=Anguilla anguilla TaxID=7936 RepID=A0A0E9U9U5_ANGAN
MLFWGRSIVLHTAVQNTQGITAVAPAGTCLISQPLCPWLKGLLCSVWTHSHVANRQHFLAFSCQSV